MKVLLTGGTGFVGREILAHLKRAGDHVRLLVRDSPTAELGAGIDWHCGDVTDASSLRGACEGMDAVVHLVGIISECGDTTFENVHQRGTENIIREAQSAGVKRFIFMSALGARKGAVSHYHQTKWGAEEAVRVSRLDHTIFRPSIIYGPGDEFVNRFAELSKWSPILPVMGRGKLQPISVELVAMCFEQALRKPETVGRTFDLCGPELLSLGEILSTICQVKDRRRILLRIPMPLARFLAVVSEWAFPAILRKPAPLNRDQLIMLDENLKGDDASAQHVFGFVAPPFRNGIAAYLRDGSGE